MLQLKDDNGKLLPQDVQDRVNNFIDGIKDIKFLKPSPNLKKVDVDKQAKFTLECFGVKAEIEYRSLKTEEDYDTARDAGWDIAWATAWATARDIAWATATALATQELLFINNPEFAKKYPNGAFTQFFKLWEMGVYPVGISQETGTFIIYANPIAEDLFQEDNKEQVIEDKQDKIIDLLKQILNKL